MSTIEPDDRVICCPECRSVFEAEDDTLVDLDALAARLASVKALADDLPALTEGPLRAGTSPWPECDRDAYSLAIEEAQAALRAVLGADAHTEQKGAGSMSGHTAENDAPETYTRQDVAAAWDEGWVARSAAESRGPSVIPPNPYGRSGTTPLGRVIPPGSDLR